MGRLHALEYDLMVGDIGWLTNLIFFSGDVRFVPALFNSLELTLLQWSTFGRFAGGKSTRFAMKITKLTTFGRFAMSSLFCNVGPG